MFSNDLFSFSDNNSLDHTENDEFSSNSSTDDLEGYNSDGDSDSSLLFLDSDLAGTSDDLLDINYPLVDTSDIDANQDIVELNDGEEINIDLSDDGNIDGSFLLGTSLVSTIDTDALDSWHEQTYDDTCSIVAQEYILDSLGQELGINFTEDELMTTATECGWYTPDGGTPMLQVGNLLEAYGIGVERRINASLDNISQQIEVGNKVLVAVDGDEIWYSDDIDDDDFIANLKGMPGQEPNHTVQVIGIDNSDPNNPMVIINDPGTPDGKGLRVSANDFVNAWEDSNYYMVSTTGRNIDPNMTQLAVNNGVNVNSILLGSVNEGDYQKSWGDSYQNDADDARDWANRYASDGNVDKVMEFEKKAAEAQEKANEYHQNAQEAYRNV